MAHELNPDGQVWNNAKSDVGKKIIQSKDDMERVILSTTLFIQNKVELVKIFFKLPNTLYTKYLNSLCYQNLSNA